MNIQSKFKISYFIKLSCKASEHSYMFLSGGWREMQVQVIGTGTQGSPSPCILLTPKHKGYVIKRTSVKGNVCVSANSLVLCPIKKTKTLIHAII